MPAATTYTASGTATQPPAPQTTPHRNTAPEVHTTAGTAHICRCHTQLPTLQHSAGTAHSTGTHTTAANATRQPLPQHSAGSTTQHRHHTQPPVPQYATRCRNTTAGTAHNRRRQAAGEQRPHDHSRPDAPILADFSPRVFPLSGSEGERRENETASVSGVNTPRLPFLH